MRKIAFGYSTRCNIRCSHCVAAGENPATSKMEIAGAKDIIRQLIRAEVQGISFTAGEPFIYLDDLAELINLCSENGVYTRVVTNSYWAKTTEQARERLHLLSQCGVSQLRLSYSRWHQQHVPKQHVLNASRACEDLGVDSFISFITDFSEQDDPFEQYLRDNRLKFFPEPVIYAGRAEVFNPPLLFTDYQENCCQMNPYLAPDLTMYACCDAGSKFSTTNFFRLGSLNDWSVEQLLTKSETSILYNCIRTMGVTTIASYGGMKSRDIVTYRKCDLCRKMFNDPETLLALQKAAPGSLLKWHR